MARVPKIDSPCPLNASQRNAFVDDFCTHCERQVHDLTTLSSAQREQFLQGCDQEICVSYSISTKIPKRNNLHAALLTVAITASTGIVPAVNAQEPFCDLEEVVITGGVRKPSNAEWIDVEEEGGLPDLPIVVEVVDHSKGGT